jgi:hypothetical protein
MTGLGLLASTLLKDRSNIPLDPEFEHSGLIHTWTPAKR